jgi:hypothetical protein
MIQQLHSYVYSQQKCAPLFIKDMSTATKFTTVRNQKLSLALWALNIKTSEKNEGIVVFLCENKLTVHIKNQPDSLTKLGQWLPSERQRPVNLKEARMGSWVVATHGYRSMKILLAILLSFVHFHLHVLLIN